MNRLTHAELLASLSGQKPGYGSLLETQEWWTKRQGIVSRDGGLCTGCGSVGREYLPGMGYVTVRTEVTNRWPVVDPEDPEEKVLDYQEETEIVVERGGAELNVHHSYYIRGVLPWEYPDESLTTWCSSCHEAFHENGTAPVYDRAQGEMVEVIGAHCRRCGDSGYLPHFNHVQGGVCFRCGGSGDEKLV